MTDTAGPLHLIVPGIDNSGPRHWQTLWEREGRNFRRADLGSWDAPQRDRWLDRLEAEVERIDRDILLIAHSLGCLAVAGWAARRGSPSRVLGALLVAPPEVEEGAFDPRLPAFAPCPRARLPFPAIVAASENDPYATVEQSRRMAEAWGARLVNCGAIGHINGESDIGEWVAGRILLDDLIALGRDGHSGRTA